MKAEVLSDADIVALFFARSPDALTAVQTKFAPYLHTVAFNILTSREDAEECVNDSWLRAWDSIPPKKPERLGAYLAKVVRRLALNRLEKQNAGKRGGGELPLVLDELCEVWDPADSVESRMEAEALHRALDAFLALLPREKRAAFVGRYFCMDGVKVIAARLGISEGKVKSMLHRTRAALRRYLEQEGLL